MSIAFKRINMIGPREQGPDCYPWPYTAAVEIRDLFHEWVEIDSYDGDTPAEAEALAKEHHDFGGE